MDRLLKDFAALVIGRVDAKMETVRMMKVLEAIA
jgi:hypothetical protein